MSSITPLPLPDVSDLKPTGPAITVTEHASTPPLTLLESIESLKPQLSSEAKVHFPGTEEYDSSTKRWSTYHAPASGAVVNVASEADIAATIKWANANSVSFLAQSGGHGFTKTLSSLPPNSIIINLRALNQVTVSLESGTATISAGALTSEVIEAAHSAGAHVVTGVCNAVGAISPILGGGLGNLMALYGLGVDNMLEARLVTATGDVVIVSHKENEDLWWGLKGAGHNFGIVSELKVKAHPQVNGGLHWGGVIAFPGTEEYLEKVVGVMRGLRFAEEGKPMSVTMIWAKAPPQFHPTILLALWYAGPAEIATKEFAPLLSLNPVMNATAPIPYTSMNQPSDFACVKNGHKRPPFARALAAIPSIATFQTLFKQWINFIDSDTDFSHSVVLTELYGWKKTSEVQSMNTAYPWREARCWMMANPEFAKEESSAAAETFGRRFRDVVGEGMTYVNFASGDEDIGEVYGGGERLEKLRALKKRWDPEGRFSFYNPIV